MIESLEERVADLERMVLRQAERISSLEERLETAQRVLAVRMLRTAAKSKDEAA